MAEPMDTMVQQRVWAVVGVSDAHEKFGRRIFEALRGRGYEVYAVNSRLPEGLDDGTPTYPSVRELPVVPAVVNVVVPPALGMGIVEDCAAAGVPGIWFQPGAESLEAVAHARSRGLMVAAGGPCALVLTRTW